MTEFNACVKKSVEIDALAFQVTSWLMHKLCKRLCYRGNNLCCPLRLKATGYLDH